MGERRDVPWSLYATGSALAPDGFNLVVFDARFYIRVRCIDECP